MKGINGMNRHWQRIVWGMKTRALRGLSVAVLTMCLMVGVLGGLASGQPVSGEDAGEATREKLIAAYEASDWPKVIVLAKSLAQAHPEEAVFWSALGTAYGQNRETMALAEESYVRVMALLPDDAQNMKNLAIVRDALDSPEALETAFIAARLNPGDASLQRLVGQRLQQSRRRAEAAEYFLSAYALDPLDVVSLTAATSYFFERGQHDRALALTQQGIEGGVPGPVLYLNMVSGLMDMGRYEEAVVWADKGFERYRDVGLVLNKAVSLNQLGQYAQAESLLRGVREMIPEQMRAPFDYALGKSLLMQGCTKALFLTCHTGQEDDCCSREREALSLLTGIQDERLLSDASFAVDLGLAYALGNLLEDAEAVLRRAAHAKISRPNGNALAALAVTLYLFGDKRGKDASVRFYRDACETAPDLCELADRETRRLWPSRGVEILTEIQAYEAEGARARTEKSGCGCTLSSRREVPLSASVLVLGLVFVAVCWRRTGVRG